MNRNLQSFCCSYPEEGANTDQRTNATGDIERGKKPTSIPQTALPSELKFIIVIWQFK